MVVKTKSDNPIKLIKGEKGYRSWLVPELSGSGKAPSFNQPVEENKVIKPSEAVEVELVDKVTPDELQAIRDAAYEEGFQEGKTEGLAAAQSDIDAKCTLLTDTLQQLAAPLEQCESETQQQILQLAFAVARQIVRRELQQDPSQIIAIIREALNLLPVGAQNVAILLHPEDAKIVRNVLSLNEDNGEDEESSADDNSWVIKSDPSIERGSCLVNTENSKVDASIDKQIAVLFSRIVGGQRVGETDAE
ncbi:flagellar assembly protein FliH [Aliikangiella sp. IMCC44632]